MTITFERPIGSHLDVKELQYLSALHQTGLLLRQDATVTAEDVVCFLMSRHGIQADIGFVNENLMPGLAGALGDSSFSVFDIVEIVGILLIPHLKREDASVDSPDSLFSKVLRMILKDATGSTETPILDRALMQNILETYGEFEVPAEIIDEMMLAAGAHQNPTHFDAMTLMKACTGDTTQYNIQWDTTFTTHYDDVFQGTSLDGLKGTTSSSNTQRAKNDDVEDFAAKSKFDEGQQVKRVYTAPSIDGIAENYNSKTFVTTMWVLVVVVYFTYILNLTSSLGGVECERFQSEFPCKVVNAIIAWLIIFVQLSVLGFTFVFLSSAGNSIYSARSIGSFLYLLVGMVTVIGTTILAYVFEFQFIFINTNRDETNPTTVFQYTVILVLGCVLLLFQLKALFFFFVPKANVASGGMLSFLAILIVPGMAKAENATKQAASFKADKMVSAAIALHEGTLAGSSLRSSTKRIDINDPTAGTEVNGFGDALLNFHATVDDREYYGGVIWCWKSMWNGKIWIEDGVWIHARLYAMNCAQLFVCILFIILYVVFYRVFDSFFNPSQESTFAPSISPFPTSSPTTFDVELYYATLLLPLINDFVANYLLYSAGAGNYSESIWTLVNETTAKTFSAALLESLPVNVLEYLAQNLDLNTLQILASYLTAGDGSEGLVNGTDNMPGNFTVFRDLQSMPSDNFMFITNSPSALQNGTIDDSVNWIPKRWEAAVGVTCGGVAAITAAFSLFVIWVPSGVSTILQFRAGVIGSLRDRDFIRYRAAPDLVGVLFGSSFWGALFASFTLFILVGTVVFVCVYHVTSPYVILFLAQLIGIMVTVFCKVIILLCLRRVLFSGFYRKSPAVANCLMVVMECWNLALTVVSMLQRLIKLLLVSSFYVGRLDTPLLANGVGNLGPIPLDDYPIQFRKDLLLHDAHRHPYMERLGVMYMLKLRYGDEFATRAGSAWRLIFVMALMPWLRRFRINEEIEEEVIVTPEQKAIDRVKAKKQMSQYNIGESGEVGDDFTEVTEKGADNPDDEKKKLRKEVGMLKKKLASVKKYLKENGSDIVDTIVWEVS